MLVMTPFLLLLVLVGLPTALLMVVLAAFALLILDALYLTATLRRGD